MIEKIELDFIGLLHVLQYGLGTVYEDLYIPILKKGKLSMP